MPNRRRRELNSPSVGLKPSSRPPIRPPTEPKSDADKADTDKVDADKAEIDKPSRPKTGSRPTSMAITRRAGRAENADHSLSLVAVSECLGRSAARAR